MSAAAGSVRKLSLTIQLDDCHFDSRILDVTRFHPVTDPERVEFLKASCETVTKTVLEALSPRSKDKVVVLTTGSDARAETLCDDPDEMRLSPIELIVVYESDSEEDFEPVLTPRSERLSRRERIERAVSPILEKNRSIFDVEPQIISVHNNLLVFEGKQGELVIPSRALDAIAIYGTKNMVELFQNTLKKNLRDINDAAIAKFTKDFYLVAKKEYTKTIDGKVEKTSSVNFKTGELFYNHKRIKSVKYSFLRIIQYHIVLLYMNAVNKGILSEHQIIDEMPKSIEDRLMWLHEHDLLGKMQSDDVLTLCNAYNKLIDWYTQSQKSFKDKLKKNQIEVGKIDTIFVDPMELESIRNAIDQFLDKAK